MLKQFHYIDQNGKDQGINVRNRSSELAKLLSDVDTIRQERKKARANKHKYGGVEGGASLGGGFSSGGSRYGGFEGGSSSFGGGYGGEVYGDGGGFGGQDPDLRFQSTQRRADEFEEYDAGDAEEAPARRTTTATTSSSASAARSKPQSQAKSASKPAEPVKDLFSFDDDEPATLAQPTVAQAKPAQNTMDSFGGDDDDFDDFQSATPAPAPSNTLAALSPAPTTSIPTATTQFAAPQPMAPPPINSILSAPSPAPSATSSVAGASSVTSPSLTSKPLQPAGGFKQSGPNYFTSVRADINTSSAQTPSSAFSSKPQSGPASQGWSSSTSMATLGKPETKTAAAKPSGGDAFGSLWSTASSKAGVQQKAAPTKGPGMAAMQKEKSSAGIWGAASSASTSGSPAPMAGMQNQAAGSGTGTQPQKPATQLGNGLDDLLG